MRRKQDYQNRMSTSYQKHPPSPPPLPKKNKLVFEDSETVIALTARALKLSADDAEFLKKAMHSYAAMQKAAP